MEETEWIRTGNGIVAANLQMAEAPPGQPALRWAFLDAWAIHRAYCPILGTSPQITGYQPMVLEIFVEEERFRGTCYKADNWVHVS